MRYYYCDHCDTGADETQVGQRRVCPHCERSLKLTSTTLSAHDNFRRERSGQIVASFIVTGELLEFCKDCADEDSAIHVDHLMDFGHDQENSDLIGFLMEAGPHTDYVFLED